MEVVLYSFSKRENSTSRPTDGQTYNGQIKEGCSVLSPSITFQFANYPAYNYMYIPAFSRYYSISDWQYSQGLWMCNAEVDVLASWRDGIGASTQYILRSSAEKDGGIVDNMYPAKAVPTIRNLELDLGLDSLSGIYVLGIIGKGGNGAVTYYTMTPNQFETFSGFLLGDSAYLGDLGDVTADFAKMQFNPFQYITKVLWFPIGKVLGTPVASVDIGWWNVGQECQIVDAPLGRNGFIEIPAHPQSSARGEYLNCAPYTRATLISPIFGTVPLNTSILAGRSFRADLWIDYVTGEGTLWLYDDSTQNLVSILSGQIGVPVQMAQIAVNKMGATTSLISSALSFASGNIAGGISAIGNAVESSFPQLQTSGTNGSKAAYGLRWKILVEYYTPVDDNNEDRGSPLCKRRQISSIPGYIMVSDADISLAATSAEIAEIKQYMEGGFFYE